MNEVEEITELLKGLRIRIADEAEYRITDEQAKELAHELYADMVKAKLREK